MPTIELLAEIELWKQRARQTSTYFETAKRERDEYFERVEAAAAEIEALKAMLHKSETQAEQYRRELAALKKDARFLAEFMRSSTEERHNIGNQYLYDAALAAHRIIEATKEEP